MIIRVLVLDDELKAVSNDINKNLETNLVDLFELNGKESNIIPTTPLNNFQIELSFVSNLTSEVDALEVAENIKKNKYSGNFDLVLVDDNWQDKAFGGQDYLLDEVFNHIKGITDELPIIGLFTRHGEEPTRIIKLYNLIYEKYPQTSRIIPCHKTDKLRFLYLISRVANEKKLILERDYERENSNFFRRIVTKINNEPPKESFCGIYGKSTQNQLIFHLIKSYSESTQCVLLQGKTGTGKGVIAKAIHKTSNRNGKYEEVNCAAIPEAFLETELFGYDKKSGIANANPNGKLGKFEIANNGTLFLDEIGKMPLQLQAKILKAVEDKKIRRVSGIEEIPLNIRFIAAASENLEELASQGLFLPDLYHRLNVLPIDVPDLKDRKEDIDILAKHFLHNSKEANDKNITSISKNATNILINYSWPGNIRELENCIKRAIVICDGSEIKSEHIIIGKENSVQHSRIENLPVTLIPTPITDIEKNLGETVQNLRMKELDIAYQILSKTFTKRLGKPNYKEAAYILKENNVLEFKDDSPNYFHRYVVDIFEKLNLENKEKSLEKYYYLPESIVRKKSESGTTYQDLNNPENRWTTGKYEKIPEWLIDFIREGGDLSALDIEKKDKKRKPQKMRLS